MTAVREDAKLDLAVVIVTWNSADTIAAALDSLLSDLRDSGLRCEILVVDSASGDQSADLVRRGFPGGQSH